MKVSLSSKKIFSQFTIILIIFAIVFALVSLFIQLKPVYSVYYKGKAFTFRQDVKTAEKVPVYPSEDTLGLAFWDYKIKNITIMFVPENKSNGYYQLEAFELTYKINQIYATMRPLIIEKNFSAQPIESYDNITREEGILKVILVPPSMSNETIVKVGGNKVFIYGRDYKGLDLATVKTILSVMKYNGNYTYIKS